MTFRCRLFSTIFLCPVWAVIVKSLRWCSGIGCNSQSPLAFKCGTVSTIFCNVPCKYALVTQCYPSVHWVNLWQFSGILVYTGTTNVHRLSVFLHNTINRDTVYVIREVKYGCVVACMTFVVCPTLFNAMLYTSPHCERQWWTSHDIWTSSVKNAKRFGE